MNEMNEAKERKSEDTDSSKDKTADTDSNF